MKNYDAIVIGAGSIGVPAALYLAEKKLQVLVLESEHAPGQQNNKKAIEGSEPHILTLARFLCACAPLKS
jgi:glycine/D-amino acid oxidase-like deaminating enzyme